MKKNVLDKKLKDFTLEDVKCAVSLAIKEYEKLGIIYIILEDVYTKDAQMYFSTSFGSHIAKVINHDTFVIDVNNPLNYYDFCNELFAFIHENY